MKKFIFKWKHGILFGGSIIFAATKEEALKIVPDVLKLIKSYGNHQ